MIDPKKINDLVSQVMASLPPGVKQIPKEFETHVRAALHSAFEKSGLVTQEEFDIQSGVLSETRRKLEALEKRLAKLESHTPVSRTDDDNVL